MAKPKVSNSEILTYLQERKKSLKKELEQVEKVLKSIDVDEKPSGNKGKKKNKKKLEKAVKAIRKKVAEAIEGVKSVSESTPPESTATQPAASVADKGKRTPSVKTIPVVSETAEVPKAEKQPVRRVRKPRVVADKPARASSVAKVPTPSTFKPSSTMDEKIRFALGQKRNSTKEELIEYLNGLEPDYGLSKLRKVIAFRLNHLLKTGKIKGKDSKAGIRYAN